MNTAIEETGTAQAATEKPKAKKKARVGAQGAHVAAKKAKVGKKGSGAKKAPKAAKKAGGSREGSKAANILDLLKRPDGATLAELMRASGWQAHSRARLPVRDREQKAWTDGHLHQGRGRRANLLRQGLTSIYSVRSAPPGFRLAAFLVGPSAYLARGHRVVRQRRPERTDTGTSNTCAITSFPSELTTMMFSLHGRASWQRQHLIL